jgi:hypothetical protein
VANVNFKLPDGTTLRLRLKPDLVAADSIEKLTSSDPEAKRKALTQMKSRLQVPPPPPNLFFPVPFVIAPYSVGNYYIVIVIVIVTVMPFSPHKTTWDP